MTNTQIAELLIANPELPIIRIIADTTSGDEYIDRPIKLDSMYVTKVLYGVKTPYTSSEYLFDYNDVDDKEFIIEEIDDHFISEDIKITEKKLDEIVREEYEKLPWKKAIVAKYSII